MEFYALIIQILINEQDLLAKTKTQIYENVILNFYIINSRNVACEGPCERSMSPSHPTIFQIFNRKS